MLIASLVETAQYRARPLPGNNRDKKTTNNLLFPDKPALRVSRHESRGSSHSMQQVQRIVAVVNEVDAFPIESNRQTEERPSSLPGSIDCLHRNLRPSGCGLDHIAVACVDGQNIAVGSNGEPQRPS